MALEKQKSRICEEDENEEQHCHRYNNKENEKKWIFNKRTLRIFDWTGKLNMDMILDNVVNIINITIGMNNPNGLICLMGFHSIKHLKFVSRNSISREILIFLVNWTKMIGWMETQMYFQKLDVNNKNGTSKTMEKKTIKIWDWY